MFLDGAFHRTIAGNAESSSLDHILALDISTEKFYTLPLTSPTFLVQLTSYLTKFTNSLGVVKFDEWQDQFLVWELVHSRKKSSRRVKHYSTKLESPIRNNYFCEILGMLGRSNILRKVRDKANSRKKSFAPLSDHLLVYNANEKRSTKLDMFRCNKEKCSSKLK